MKIHIGPGKVLGYSDFKYKSREGMVLDYFSFPLNTEPKGIRGAAVVITIVLQRYKKIHKNWTFLYKL